MTQEVTGSGWQIEYDAGGHMAIVAPEAMALLSSRTPAAVVAGLWVSMQDGRGLIDYLNILSGSGLEAVEPFGLCVHAADGWHVLVHGPTEAIVTTAKGTEAHTAAGVTTWAESVLTHLDILTLQFPSAAGGNALEPAGALPIVGGIVPARAVHLRTLPVSPATIESKARPARASRRDRAAVQAEPIAVPEPAPAQPVSAEPIAPVLVPEPAAAQAPSAPAPVTAVEEPAAPTFTSPAYPKPAPHGPIQRGPVPVPPKRPVVAALPATDDGPSTEPYPGLASGAAPAQADQAEPEQQSAEAKASQPAVADDPAKTQAFPRKLTKKLRRSESHADAAETKAAVPWPTADTPDGPAKPLVKLVLSTGRVIAVDRPVVLGRAPRSSKVPGIDSPHLVNVPSPRADISRTHAAVTIANGKVFVTDLNSTNGTMMTRPGKTAEQLPPDVPTVLEPGSRLDLGEEVSVLVEPGS